MGANMNEEPNGKPVQSLKKIIGQREKPVSVEDMTEACAEACMPKPLTVAELIDVPRTLPAAAIGSGTVSALIYRRFMARDLITSRQRGLACQPANWPSSSRRHGHEKRERRQ